MNTETKKFKLDIFGDQYSLISDEKEEYLIRAADMVNFLMKEIAGTSKVSDTKKIAVLAALRIAHNLVHLESTIEAYNEEQRRLAELIDKKGLSSHSSTT